MTELFRAEVLTLSEDQHQHALALFQAGKYQEAARILTGLVQDGETSEFWNDWATAQLMCNQVSESERGYRRALELDPANNRAAGNLGALLARSGRVAEALPFLDEAAKTSENGEREQLLRLIQSYRDQLAKTPRNNVPKTNLLAQMASAIHQQSVAIAALAKRLSALEAKAFPSSGAHHDPATAAVNPMAAESGSTGLSGVTHNGPAPKSRPKPGVLFCGPVYGASGYAEESWAAAVALAENQIPLQLAPAGEKKDTKGLIPEEAKERLEYLQRQSVDIPNSIIYQAAPAHYWDMNRFGRACVGRTMYETDRIPESFRERCNAMDEVWVPSQFNMETFAAGGVNPQKLHYVPGGIDTRIFRPDVEPLNIPKKRSFNFVSVFDWQDRKGYDVLLRAYLHEFKADDDVALILKVYQMVDGSSDLTETITQSIEWEAKLSLEKAPTIILINGFMSQQDMVRFYAAGHCFVLPTHGEGYGRPFLEALACELPVIATDWGGQMDFLNDRNSSLIESKLIDVPKDVEVSISAGHRWAQPDSDHLRHLMREVYSHPEEARRRAKQGREDVLRNYDWSAVVPLWVHEFKRLLN